MTTGHEQGDSGLPYCEPWRRLPFAAKRQASWSREGYNRDWRHIAAGKEQELADIPGCGFITRLWLALDTHNAARNPILKVSDPLFLRKTVLRIFWDDADYPSIDVPVGDFFAIGHGAMRSFSSALVDISATPGDGRGSLTSWFRMPFFSRARVVLRNEGEHVLRAFWHVDYQRWETLPQDLYHFHASWRCEMPCPPTPLEPGGKEGANLSGDDNYVILDATGAGTYIGCHLSVDNHDGGWWGEGDDMVFVDGEPFPGSLHGTGQEEYFGQGWGMQDVQYPWFGTSLFNHGHRNWEGRWSMYRFHVADPIPFRQAAFASPWSTATTTTAPTTTRPRRTGIRKDRSRSRRYPPLPTACHAAPPPAHATGRSAREPRSLAFRAQAPTPNPMARRRLRRQTRA